MEWRHEAQEVAQEALAQKYPQLITSESDMELFRYSTPSVRISIMLSRLNQVHELNDLFDPSGLLECT